MYLSDISILTSEVDFSTLVMSFLYDLHECRYLFLSREHIFPIKPRHTGFTY